MKYPKKIKQNKVVAGAVGVILGTYILFGGLPSLYNNLNTVYCEESSSKKPKIEKILVNGLFPSVIKKDYNKFLNLYGAKWIEIYNGEKGDATSKILEVYFASQGIATESNGLKDENIPSYSKEYIGYSAGGTSLLALAKQGKISGDTMILIDPILVTQEDLSKISKQFKNIIVYKGNPLNLCFFNCNKKDLKDPLYSNGYTRELVDEIEKTANKGELEKILFEKNTANAYWKNGEVTQIILCPEIYSEKNIKVIERGEIGHDEWLNFLNEHYEKYGNLPDN